MPRYLVTERVYVDADDGMQALDKTARPWRAGEGIQLKEHTADRVAPELEVGMPVRLLRTDGHLPVFVPVGSEGVVVEKGAHGGAHVFFHAPHAQRTTKHPWTRQYVYAEDLEVVEGWSS